MKSRIRIILHHGFEPLPETSGIWTFDIKGKDFTLKGNWHDVAAEIRRDFTTNTGARYGEIVCLKFTEK